MVSLSRSKGQKPLKHGFEGYNSTGSAQPPSGGSLLRKQQQMRVMIAERLPKADLCSVSSSFESQGFQLLHSGLTVVRIESIAEAGYKNFLPDDHKETCRQQQYSEKGQTAQGHGALNYSREASEAYQQKEQNGKLRDAGKAQRRFSLKVGNASVKRLLSGAFAGAVSRTAVAPLETIRTHLMVGSGGRTVGDVFQHIMHNEGWQGLFRGNGVNVIRVAPSKAIEVSMPACVHWEYRVKVMQLRLVSIGIHFYVVRKVIGVLCILLSRWGFSRSSS
ncbi:hypothetical protein GOP47_0007092 [Adiantum capillus-veneris]|uniref:Uncharacterized protein n=1 Tax=Adiantum capillus-veneris TaxID=13818 RepID=A0A9D4V0X2_ADICA|nr:hypothetical protein GOP47_0007092 [Adiantum capillus-veneris]